MNGESRANVTLLQLVPEVLPTHRPDVTALFGHYLPRLGIHSRMVGKGGPGDASPDSPFTSEHRSSPQGSRLQRELFYFLLCLRRLAAARKDGVDLIQVRDMVSIGLLARLLAWLRGMPFVYWMSFPMSEDRIQRARQMMRHGRRLRGAMLLVKGVLEQALLYKVVLPSSDHIFVQSEAMRDMLVARGLPAARMTPVPMGVDTELLATAKIRPRRPPGWESAQLFAYLGTLDPNRQVETIVEALCATRTQYPAARLLLIGDTSNATDRAALDDKIAALGQADAVHVTGWLPAAQAWTLMSGADACVSYVPRSPIFDVSSPTKLLEYLALGLPAIANDNPDQEQVLLSSGAGWLCPSSATGLTRAMVQILSDLPSARQRSALGQPYIEHKRSYLVLSQDVARRYRVLTGRKPHPSSLETRPEQP